MTNILSTSGPFRIEVVDGMTIEWDVPIEADDGVVLRADIFRPTEPGTYPTILSYGPYGKGLPFQQSFPAAWQKLIAEHPDVIQGSSGKYQVWELADPEKWVPDGYVCVRVDSRGTGRSPGHLDLFSKRESLDLYACIEWAAGQSWSNGRVGLMVHLSATRPMTSSANLSTSGERTLPFGDSKRSRGSISFGFISHSPFLTIR
jgi:predicted acyl esterase